MTKKEYLKAKAAIKEYEDRQSRLVREMNEYAAQFPVGSMIESGLNSNIRGEVIGFRVYSFYIKIDISTEDGLHSSISAHNARLVTPDAM